MRIEKTHKLRAVGISVLGALVLGLVLACSLFNQAPIAVITTSVLSGNSPLAVTFSASTSTDADGIITLYIWDFGDGSETKIGSDVQHTFIITESVKIFEVTLTVTDEDGASAQATQTIEVHLDGDASTGTGVPTARFTADKFIGVSPMTVTFDATTSTAGAGTIIAYNWDFIDGAQATGVKATHTFIPDDPEETTTYPVTLFVWNSDSQVDTEQVNITVIVPENETQDDAPIADIFVDDPDLIYWATGDNDEPIGTWLFEVKLDPRGSSADAGHSLEYFAWDFGDGDIQVETSDLELTHIYELPSPSRTFVARLTVFDDAGLEDTAIVNITLIQEEEEE